VQVVFALLCSVEVRLGYQSSGTWEAGTHRGALVWFGAAEAF